MVRNNPGATNDFMKNIDVIRIPDMENPETVLKPMIDKEYKFNVRDLFISEDVDKFYDSFSYYYYDGSLTFP